MESPRSPQVPKQDLTIRKIAALDARLQCYTPQYTVLLSYILINTFLFFFSSTREYVEWQKDRFRAWTISIARGFGLVLNFNLSLQMLFPCRNLLTVLRRTRLSLLLPLDQAMPQMHTIVGTTSFIAALLHTICHCIYGLLARRWTLRFGGWTHLFVTGLVLILVLSLMVFTSLPFIKRRNFEVFIAIHIIGTTILLLLLIFHGLHKGVLSTYLWILAPTVTYVVDKLYGIVTTKKASAKVKLGTECKHLKEGGIVRLSLKKPFEYRAGQYAELCIPRISKYQWHAFTFASAPYESKAVFYIKKKGNWTNELLELCKRKFDTRSRTTVRNLEVRIRGPYGSPTEHAGQYDKVVLISGGVGATPFCSLVKEMTHGFLERRNEEGMGRHEAKCEEDESRVCNDSNGSSHEGRSGAQAPELTAAGRTVTSRPKGGSQSGRNGSISLKLNKWVQLVHAISGTSTFNSLMIWIMMIRLFMNAISIGLGFSDQASRGRMIVGYVLLQAGDLAFASVYLIGLCLAIGSEALCDKHFHLADMLLSTPLAFLPVILAILTLSRAQLDRVNLSRYNLAIIWPLTILLFLVRYFRILGERALLCAGEQTRREVCRSVDFIWTTRRRTEDSWLLTELHRSVLGTKYVRLHRFITRESREYRNRHEDRGQRATDLMRSEMVGLHYGRPDWDAIFRKVIRNVRNGATVGIFFCGPGEMAGCVKQAATLSMFDSRYRAMRRHTCRVDVRDVDGGMEECVNRSFNVRYVFRNHYFS